MTKIGQIYVPNKFAQICHIPPKIKFEILAHRGSQTTSPHARRLSRIFKPRAMEQLHLLASMILDRSVEPIFLSIESIDFFSDLQRLSPVETKFILRNKLSLLPQEYTKVFVRLGTSL